MESNFNKDKAIGNIEVILEKLHSDTDLALLKQYNKLYKKEISLFKRGWAAAWLFMYYDQKEIPPAKIIPVLKKGEDKSSCISLPEEVSKKLFISIGKNRRLFPREIITLIISKTKIARDDIGMIRILDNYSFVQVRDIKADEIIKALNGIKFRGRTLTVNYAKPRSNEE
ncbi:MAG: DbpA RNA binding domain-containing protein [Treponema sp.]|nr:DbpA RNA binding domain-containing protein [Treponema sp.]MCL2272159.1 DbpA RNA binding domain-containing protein [Treponema sp.]